MDTLATYEQSFGGVRRRFILLPDHLAVRGRRFGSTFDARYDLASLSAQFDSARILAPLFHGGVVLIAIALLGAIILVFNSGLIWPALAVVGMIAFSGIACVIFRRRPLQVFVFKLKGGNYAFEVIGAGPEAVRVEQFVSSVAEQIGKEHGETRVSPSTSRVVA
ncbi:MAG: hypothetical protein HY298_21425 [Verrucomicrobia bacterium]|nr:hypothetical protein [Verrucomicrobiota bacterium]